MSCLFALPALTGAVGRQAREELRLLVHGGLPEDAADGLRFGVAEASATARLMGRTVRMLESGRADPSVWGIFAATFPDTPLPADVPVLVLEGRRDRRASAPACTFSVGLSPADRAEALARWQARAGASPPEGAAVVEWHPALVRYGAGELNERYRKASGRRLHAAGWLAWFAVKALVETALRYPDLPACQALATGRFDGHKGRALTFDPESRALRQPVYVVCGDTVLGEISLEARG